MIVEIETNTNLCQKQAEKLLLPYPKPAPSATVAVAMSGGVDSSLTAALLKEEGYHVVGITMQLFQRQKEYASCTSDKVETATGHAADSVPSDELDGAIRVARHLGIPHHILDMKDLFQEKVITPFLIEYLNGRTPNPCVICNRNIKFKALWHKAKELGADYLATGHYIEVGMNHHGHPTLLRGADPGKDQSYFLCQLDRSMLEHILFPVGNMDKEVVRRMAAMRGLPTAARKESQEACFMEDEGLESFIRQKVDPAELPQPGPIVNSVGQVVGKHRGIHTLTIGQRKGIGLGGGNPVLHVTHINASTDTVQVGPPHSLMHTSFIADGCTWLTSVMNGRLDVLAQIRYRHRAAPATLQGLPADNTSDYGGEVDMIDEPERVRVCFLEPQRAITPGQFVAFYMDRQLIGGGRIIQVEE